MKRNEEIKKAAEYAYAHFGELAKENKLDGNTFAKIFALGIEWADAHQYRSVKDELPPEGVHVSVRSEDGYFHEDFIEDGEFNGDSAENKVTHWAPVPKELLKNDFETKAPSKERIEEYREEYKRYVHNINDTPNGNDDKPLTGDELDEVLNRVTDELAIDLIRQGVPPESAAYDFIHYN